MTTDTTQENIISGELTEIFPDKYGEFAVSACARALLDVRDGLKVVHRRVMYASSQKAPASRGTVKSANIVGHTLAELHPHGDSSVYDAMCRMTRDYVLTTPMLQGQGNFGAIDGSNAAAMRYTECRTDPTAAWLMLDGLDAGAVPFRPTYDQKRGEPMLLPVKLPVFLLNGGEGMASGFAMSVPPHNAAELAAATLVVLDGMIEGRETSVDEILAVMPGPDLPTGGLIGNSRDIRQIYETGSGSIKMRADVDVDEEANLLVFKSVPYGVSTSAIVESVGEAAAGKVRKVNNQNVRDEPKVPEVRAVRDETSANRRTGQVVVRIVVELKRDADPYVVLEKLYEHTRLADFFAVNMTALDPMGRPKQYGVVSAIQEWADFRSDCIRRVAGADLQRVRDRQHVIEGLEKALDAIDKVIAIVRGASNDEAAASELRAQLGVTSKQADAILSMPIRRLCGLQRTELRGEYASLDAQAVELLQTLTSPAKVVAQIREEVQEAAKRLGRPRRSKIVEFGAYDPRNTVVPEYSLITLSSRGYIRRVPADEFRAQNKGGKGRQGAKVREDDALTDIVGCHSLDRLFAITDGGVVVRLEAHEVATNSLGRHSANLGFEENERVKAVLASPWPIPQSSQVLVGTTGGEVKRVMLDELSSKMTKRLVFFRSAAEDDIAGGFLVPQGADASVFMASAQGQGIRFSPEDVRLTKRDSGGVRGMDLREGDSVVAMGRISSPDELILCVTSDGIGKRVSSEQFPVQGRGGFGRILIRPKPGAALVAALVVKETDHVLIATKNGQTVRIRVGDVRELGRSAMGSRLVALNDKDRVLSAAVLPADAE